MRPGVRISVTMTVARTISRRRPSGIACQMRSASARPALASSGGLGPVSSWLSMTARRSLIDAEPSASSSPSISPAARILICEDFRASARPFLLELPRIARAWGLPRDQVAASALGQPPGDRYSSTTSIRSSASRGCRVILSVSTTTRPVRGPVAEHLQGPPGERSHYDEAMIRL
jgi:hypothetical protein